MIYTARMRHDADGYVADCLELEATGLGATQADALESLQRELVARIGQVECVAPPPATAPVEIELVVIEDD
jgi:hypothetical protein